MTHIETLKSQLKELEEQKEKLTSESFDIKIKIRFNEKRAKLIAEEIIELTKDADIKQEE